MHWQEPAWTRRLTCLHDGGVVPGHEVCEGEDVMLRLLHCPTLPIRTRHLLERGGEGRTGGRGEGRGGPEGDERGREKDGNGEKRG